MYQLQVLARKSKSLLVHGLPLMLVTIQQQVTVIVELYANSYESFTVQEYNSEGQACDFTPAYQKRKPRWLRIKGCPKCKAIKFEEE